MALDYRERKELRDYLEERRLAGRLLVVRISVILAFALLLGFYWYLQVVRGEEYARLAEENMLQREVVQPLRGRILDCHGRPLASNRPGFNIYWNRERVREEDRTALLLASLLETGSDAVYLRLRQASRRPTFRPVLISEGEAFRRAAAVDARRLELPGIRVQEEAIRYYDHGGIAAHSVGYLRQATEEEIDRADGTLALGDLVGKTGVERALDRGLRGEKGLYLWQVDSHGRRLKVDRQLKEPSDGPDLMLALDLQLQQALMQGLGDRSGAGVFLDPHSGAVLALASAPTFDPNLFSGRFSREEWRTLTEDPRHPLQNRALQGKYSPGSTFKVVVATAALEEGWITPAKRIWCPGYARFYGRPFRCWKRGGHGWVNLHQAIRESCNVYFYTVGKGLGVDAMARWAERFGLGSPAGFDTGRDLPGTVPSSAWKLATLGEPWFPGETISVAIGQGFLEVTPLQMARLAAALANGGTLVRPCLVPGESGSCGGETGTVGLSPAVHRILVRAMEAVVGEPGGTGGRCRLPGIRVAGKTGTVQLVGQREPGAKGPEDHSWFIGFAPVEEPRIAFAVIVEHGGHGGSSAAPVARSILEVFFREGQEDASPVQVARATTDQ